eukprot:6115585-Pyramimonas_sp.AAC.1
MQHTPVCAQSAGDPSAEKRSKTMVVGNVAGLDALSMAEEWLPETQTSLKGPIPTKTYTEGDFVGVLFA